MASPSLPLGPNQFVQGIIRYSDYDPTQPHSRIIIPVKFGNTPTTTAIVDTGAPWCVLGPEEAQSLDSEGDFLEPANNTIRGDIVPGRLYKVPVSLEADEGTGITVMATVFIPVLMPYQEWHIPNLIGLSGFLEKIRFAVDPENNLFYFGTFSD